jgi:conjugative relaxase-like TrwC/TraI family protein
VAGFALSFSPPKSVSVLWALVDPEFSKAVRGAHEAAVAAAVSFLEEHAAFTRRGRGGLVQEDTEGLLAAVFVHRTSRTSDPQLHSHVLVANKVRAVSDGAWLALDGRELYEAQKAAGLLYKAAVRAELTAGLGVAWTPVDADGAAESVGVPDELIAAFSKRRAQVEATARRLVAEREVVLGRSLTGGERAVIYQRAAYQSRAVKAEKGKSIEQLRARWKAEAESVMGDPEEWISRVLAGPTPAADAAARGVRGRVEDPVRALIGELEQAHSTWGRSDVIEALTVRIAPSLGRSADEVRRLVEAAADHALSHPDVVALDSLSPLEPPGQPVRRDGMALTVRHGGRRYSTWQTLSLEQRVLDIVEAGRDIGVGVAGPDALKSALQTTELSSDQEAVVEQLCTNGDQVAVMIGPVGAGKSYTLAAARTAWAAARIPVRGVAPSAVAAGILTEQAGIASETVAKFLYDAHRGHIRLQRGEVIVCDEASMLPTRELPSWPAGSATPMPSWSWSATPPSWARWKPAACSACSRRTPGSPS